MTLISIPRPPTGTKYLDRDLDCQQALQTAVLAVIDAASIAGWSRAEAAVAIVDIADNVMLGDAENSTVEELLRTLRPRS